MPSDAPDKWERFIAYNERYAIAEMGIIDHLRKYPVPDKVWEEYWLSEEINDRGILVDEQLVRNAIKIDNDVRDRLLAKTKRLTGLENPNSNVQIKGWLSEHDIETETYYPYSRQLFLWQEWCGKIHDSKSHRGG